MTRPYPRTPRTLVALALGAAIGFPALLAGPVSAGAAPPPTSGDTTPSAPARGTVESYIQTFINNDRAARGLRPLRLDSRLRTIARERAATLADLGILSHSAAGDIDSQLSSQNVRWYRWGEALGWSGYAWGYSVAKSLYTMWKHSPDHMALLMSSGFNYLGVGVGYQWSGRATYASIVLSDSPDHSAPTRKMTGVSRSGTTVRFSWTGADTKLQLHTSGLRNFDVEYGVDKNGWTIIRSNTTSRSITLTHRARGHVYWLRVRARDNAGYVSSWSPALRVTVP